MRAVAILLVLGVHAPKKVFESGYIGVVVFFCLSGYLITSLLLDELRTGGVNLRVFYRRRVARLAPALIATLLVTLAVAPFVAPVSHSIQAFKPFMLALFYVGNLALAHGGDLGPQRTLYSWTWSLAIEEQFYLLWPLLLAFFYVRAPRSFVSLMCGLLAACTMVALLAGHGQPEWQPRVYFGSDTNAVPLLGGALLAIWSRRERSQRGRTELEMLGWGALGGLLLLAVPVSSFAIGSRIVGASVLAVVLLWVLTASTSTSIACTLGQGVFSWLGLRAYSIYLWNILLRQIGMRLLPDGGPLLDLLWFVIVLSVADASFRLVERPARARWSGRPRPVALITDSPRAIGSVG